MAKQLVSSLVLSAVLTSLVITLVFGDEVNVLRTGEVLGTDGKLQYGDASLIMQPDCNLVLNNNGEGEFQSDTHGRGENCSLTLNEQGQLIITNGDGEIVWRSQTETPESTPTGQYAAVLRPDGLVAVYGPMLWSTPPLVVTRSSSHDDGWLTNVLPTATNLLFSSQSLYNNESLSTRGYSLIMQDDCNLVLKNGAGAVLWQSGTAGNRQNCFVRLNHRGQLTILDDIYTPLWYNEVVSNVVGEFVLIMHLEGQAAIYGPILWSSDHHPVDATI